MNKLTVSALAFFPALAAIAVHVVEIDHPVMSPDEGLLLGNGDLSCSVYQSANDLVFRLGKGDVWDRRFDYSKQPKPPTVDEIIDGVLNCGWKVTGWNATNVEEMKKMPKGERLLEITRGTTALRVAPYPNPKPTGEMRFRLPLDLGQPEKVVQKLFIEEGRATFDFSWKRGAYHAAFEAVIDPELNVLAVAWKVDGWSEDTRLTEKPPVYVSVHRWADPDYESWVRKEIEEYPSYPGKPTEFNPGVTPLPPPQVLAGDTIEQRFHPDPLFPDGFRYRLTLKPLVRCGEFWRPALPSEGEDAYITLTGDKTTTTGAVALAVTTSRDKTLNPPPAKPFAEYLAAAKKSGAEYWAKSAFSMSGDKFLEDLWYSTYHARLAILRPGTVPPGLFFPSSLPDYSRWNGDYHANYNLQSIYWGDFTANRLDQAETFMDAVEFAMPIGRKIAKEYYNCRGCFFQLQQFPCLATEDYNGTLPLGRMAYMTGWMMNHYWEYYMFTKDREWLTKRGYPFMKECALFYLDFLKKAPHPKLPPELKDGKYHLFPSVQGESGFKSPMDFCDRDQVVVHCRHALWGAIESSKILGADEDLRAEWQDRLDNLVRSDRLKQSSPYERHCILCTSPDDGGGQPWKPAPAWDGKPAGRRDTYLGISHWSKIGIARSQNCVPERDFAAWRRDLVDWTHANGLVWGMAIRIWQRTGGWTESLSCMAPFQEMILQSWDGAIRLFPRWPQGQDVSIRSWRAQGAFLVDADFAGGKIGKVSVTSEKGEDCLVWGDWKVTDSTGETVATDRDEFGRLRFKTVKGSVYALKEAGASN